MSESHSCRQKCSNSITFKSSVGNTACTPCSVCLPQTHSTWTQIVCTAGGDSLCDTCSVCHNTSLVEVQLRARSKYATHTCQQFFDTRCGNCSVCNGSQWELTPCSETEDAICAPINFHRECAVGFYATATHTILTVNACHVLCATCRTKECGFTSSHREAKDITTVCLVRSNVCTSHVLQTFPIKASVAPHVRQETYFLRSLHKTS
jgi:hypothetical protein